jgi:outer membrane biosynthesis protein TonB
MQKQVLISVLAAVLSVVMHIAFALVPWVNAKQPKSANIPSSDQHVLQIQFHPGKSRNPVSFQPEALEVPSDKVTPTNVTELDEEALGELDLGEEDYFVAESVIDLPDQHTDNTGHIVLPPQEPPYIPVGEVDTRPNLVAPVVIPFPDAPLPKQRITAILSLFISEAGAVDRIEVSESDLPSVFEIAATQAFMNARMQPAIKDGKATRVRMKVLVEFEIR